MFTTRNEAIEYIVKSIEAGDATRDEFDIDTIADEVITVHDGPRYEVTADADEFWAVVARHAM